MLDAHQAAPTGALRPPESRALPQDPNVKGKAEAIKALLYGCSTWTLRQKHYAKLRTVHHRVLLRIIGAQRKRSDHRMTTYNRALEITRCENIETTLRTRKRLWAGTLIRMSGGRLPKRIMFGNLEGAVWRGRHGKENKWTDCVQSGIRALGITGVGHPLHITRRGEQRSFWDLSTSTSLDLTQFRSGDRGTL